MARHAYHMHTHTHVPSYKLKHLCVLEQSAACVFFINKCVCVCVCFHMKPINHISRWRAVIGSGRQRSIFHVVSALFTSAIEGSNCINGKVKLAGGNWGGCAPGCLGRAKNIYYTSSRNSTIFKFLIYS